MFGDIKSFKINEVINSVLKWITESGTFILKQY